MFLLYHTLTHGSTLVINTCSRTSSGIFSAKSVAKNRGLKLLISSTFNCFFQKQLLKMTLQNNNNYFDVYMTICKSFNYKSCRQKELERLKKNLIMAKLIAFVPLNVQFTVKNYDTVEN